MARHRAPPHASSSHWRDDLYRPSSAPSERSGAKRAPRERPPTYNTYRPRYDTPRDRQESPLRREPSDLPPVRSAVTKTKHERNNNPSTRIHSLKRQLQAPELPGLVRQERERELAALLLEQEQTKTKNNARKNLQRYHFVRFLERQKSERQLTRLTKRRDSAKDEATRMALEKQIHVTAVDLNYSKYVPLGDKYISLFPHDKSTIKKNRKFSTDKLDGEVLNEEQEDQKFADDDQSANIVRSATGVKPPLWYEVERLMEQGQSQLEALRDGKLTTGKAPKADLATVGGKEDAQMRSANGREPEAPRPGWLVDDGATDPADLDSDQDEDMGDGGFFER